MKKSISFYTKNNGKLDVSNIAILNAFYAALYDINAPRNNFKDKNLKNLNSNNLYKI